MALESQPGVKTILLSGLRATLVMEDGQSLDEAKVKAALQANRMEMESLDVKDVNVPRAAYVLQASGIT